MGMKTDIVYGYGFQLIFEEERLVDFIKNHKDSFCKSEKEEQLYQKVLQYTEEDYYLTDLLSDYPCECTAMTGDGAVISNIMFRETGIRFEYQIGDADCGSCPSVLLAQTYPWLLNEAEKDLTEDKLRDICSKYMKELGIHGKPDSIEVEYYG